MVYWWGIRRLTRERRYLQQLVRAQAARNRDLETQLAQFRPSSAGSMGMDPHGNDLATLSSLEGDDGMMSGLILANLSGDDGAFADVKNVDLGAVVPAPRRRPNGGSPSGGSYGEGEPEHDEGEEEGEDEEEQTRGRGTTRASTGRRRFPGLSAGGQEIAESALSETEEVEENMQE